MSVGFLDLVRVTLSTTGIGSTLTISAAVAGWLDFTTAGGINGTTYRYAIIDGNNTEIGTAVYNSGTNTLSGRTVTKSTNSNLPINLTNQAILAVSVAAEDLNVGGTNYGTMAAQNAASVAITGGSITGLASLGLGTLSPQSVLDAVSTSNVVIRGILSEQISSDAGAAQFNMLKYRGIPGTPTTVANNDFIGNMVAAGYDGANLIRTGSIAFKVNGTVSAGNIPTDMVFSTGATGLNERMRLWASGGLGINTASDPGLGNLAVGGTIANSVTTATPGVFGVNFIYTNTGGSTASGFNFNQQAINEQVTLTATGGITPTLQAMSYIHGINGGRGGRTSFSFTTFQQASVTQSDNPFVTTLQASYISSLSMGGTGVGAGAFGDATAFNPQVVLNSGANYYNEACAVEVNFGVAVGSSFAPNYVSGVKIAALGNHNTHAGTLESALVFTSTPGATANLYNLILVGAFDGGSSPIDPAAGSVLTISTNGGVAPVGFLYGVDFYNATIHAGGYAFRSPGAGGAGTAGFTVDQAANIASTGPVHVFGQASNSPITGFNVIGPSSGASGGVAMTLLNGGTAAGNIVGKFGNYSAVNGTSYNADFVVSGLNSSALWLGAAASTWVYVQPANTNGASPSANYTGGLAVGWNYSAGGQETNLVSRSNGAGPWSFIFSDWNGSLLTNLFYIAPRGGVTSLSSTMQGALAGNMFPQGGGTQGLIVAGQPTQTSPGNGDTIFAHGFSMSDSTIFPVPYSPSTGVLLGNAEIATVFIGNSRSGSGDPTPQGCSQAIAMGIFKTGAPAGAALYGQTGAMFLNVTGGWAGTSCTFTASCTVTNGSNVVTAASAPTNHRYFVGMAVQGASLAANTSTKGVSGNTLTLTANWTGSSGTATLTFVVGTPLTSPGTTPPGNATSAATGYNPLAGTPADCFAFNGQVQIYDNGVGGAQWMECVISQFAPGGTTAQYTTRLIDGTTTAGLAAITGTIAFHQIGRIVQFGGSAGVGGCCLVGVGNGRTFDMLASDTGWVLDSSMSAHNVSEPSLKKDIALLPSTLGMIAAIDPVTYKYAEDYRGTAAVMSFLVRNHDGIGGVIENMPDLLRSIVTIARTDGVGIKQAHMLPILWRGAQELWAHTENLLDRMNGIEARVSALEGRPAVH